MKVCLNCGKELPKGRRKYCSDECSNAYFREHIAILWWNIARSEAIKRASGKCERCGEVTYLEVHHIEHLEPFEKRWNSPKNCQNNLLVLCRPCHEKEHHPYLNGHDAIAKEQLALFGLSLADEQTGEGKE